MKNNLKYSKYRRLHIFVDPSQFSTNNYEKEYKKNKLTFIGVY